MLESLDVNMLIVLGLGLLGIAWLLLKKFEKKTETVWVRNSA